MHVLITSAGRRVSLLQGFQRAQARLFGPGAHTYAVDLDPRYSAACQIAADSAPVPRIHDPDYLDALLEHCKRWNIAIVVPTIDPELAILAAARRRFAEAGVRLAVCAPEVCATFFSKRSTADFFASKGFRSPPIIDDLHGAHYPLFAKLDNSSRSIGACRVGCLAEALRLRERDSSYVFQPLVQGDEYTIDAFVDRHGQPIAIVPRRRLEVRSGEVSKGLATKDAEIMAAVHCLCRAIEGAYGPLTVQLFKTRSGELEFIEVNPRFGGGYPLTMHAGADFAEYLLRDLRGDELEYDSGWADGTLMLRYDAEVIVRDRGI